VRDAVGKVIRMSPERIDFAEPLTTYGIDSILAVALANALRVVFSSVTNTVLFEHQTLASLVEYLVKAERDVLVRLAGPPAADPSDAREKATRPGLVPMTRWRRSNGARSGAPRTQIVIRRGGRFGDRRDVWPLRPAPTIWKRVWANLREGKNVITGKSQGAMGLARLVFRRKRQGRIDLFEMRGVHQ